MHAAFASVAKKVLSVSTITNLCCTCVFNTPLHCKVHIPFGSYLPYGKLKIRAAKIPYVRVYNPVAKSQKSVSP